MRVLCCESCSSGQRLAALTKTREEEGDSGGRDERSKVAAEHRKDQWNVLLGFLNHGETTSQSGMSQGSVEDLSD